MKHAKNSKDVLINKSDHFLKPFLLQEAVVLTHHLKEEEPK